MMERIAVIGAGTMGHGIAHVFARHGYRVSLYEAFDAVRGAVMDQIRSELAFLAGEGYIGADAVERTLHNITLYGQLELKQELFARLDRLCPAHTVLASNTSSLPLGEMIAGLPEARRARAMVCHWYNPPHLIPIAELSCFGNMDEAVFQEVYDLHVRAGKRPVTVRRDIPGLVANRILHAMAREVFHLIELGAASPEDVDAALKFGPGFRAATTGILEAADMGGLDVWCACEDNLFAQLDNSTRPCAALRDKVAQGKLGLKSGAGFFDYPEGERQAVKRAFEKRLLVQLKASEAY